MHLYPYPNPALHTCWQHIVDGKKKSYKVTGIWGEGAYQNYRVVSYELSPLAGSGKVLKVPVEKMIDLIRSETLVMI